MIKDCRHWQETMEVGGGTLWLSGTRHKPKDLKRKTPDLALFLDHSWLPFMGPELVVRGSRLEGFPDGEAIFVQWKDFGTYDQGRFTALVKLAVEYLKSGKTVEVGCIGAHGRTGTVLAGILVKAEGLKAGAAIAAVRSRYCKSAVETADQEDMIYKLTREKPPKSQGKSSKQAKWTTKGKSDFTTPSGGTTLTVSEQLDAAEEAHDKRNRLDTLTNQGALTEDEWDELEKLEDWYGLTDAGSETEGRTLSSAEWEDLGPVAAWNRSEKAGVVEIPTIEGLKEKFSLCSDCMLPIDDGCTCTCVPGCLERKSDCVCQCKVCLLTKGNCTCMACAGCGKPLAIDTGKHQWGFTSCSV